MTDIIAYHPIIHELALLYSPRVGYWIGLFVTDNESIDLAYRWLRGFYPTQVSGLNELSRINFNEKHLL